MPLQGKRVAGAQRWEGDFCIFGILKYVSVLPRSKMNE